MQSITTENKKNKKRQILSVQDLSYTNLMKAYMKQARLYKSSF